MVSRRNIGILALLGVGAFFFLRKGSSGNFPLEGPAIPQNVLQGQLLQAQFDEIGDVLDEQSTALTDSKTIINKLLNTIKGLQTPQRTTIRPTLNPTSGVLTQTSPGRNFIVNTFGKVPSNFRQ